MSGDTGEFALLASGTRKFPAGKANYLYCYEQSGLVRVDFFKDRRLVESHIMDRLTLLPEKHFDEFRITDISAAANTLRFFYGPGKFVPAADRANIGLDDTTPIRVNMTNGSITVNSSIPNDVLPKPDVIAGVAAGLLVAASAASLEVIISVPDTEPNGIRWGDSTITAAKGAYLGPGMSKVVSIENHALYVIRSGASDVTVTCNTLERV